MIKLLINGQEIEVKQFPVIIESKVYDKDVRHYELKKNDNGTLHLCKIDLRAK